MFKTRKQLKEEIRTLQDLLVRTEKNADDFRREMLDLYRKLQAREDALIPVAVFYTLTDSDFVNHPKSDSARKRSARSRMAMSLGNKIAKAIEPEEVVEDGVLIGYKYSLQVRSTSEYGE